MNQLPILCMKKVAEGNESTSETLLRKWRWKDMTMKSTLQHEPNTESKTTNSKFHARIINLCFWGS